MSEFQERVISEKLKLAKKKKNAHIECDKTNSSPTHGEGEGNAKEDEDSSKVGVEDVSINAQEEEKGAEQLEAERLKAEEEKIAKLEQKRKILETFYKKKLEEKRKSGGSVGDEEIVLSKSNEEGDKKARKDHKSTPSKKKRKKESSDSDEENSSDADSSDSDHHKRKKNSKSKHKKHKKSSKHRRSRDRHKSTSKHKKRSRRETSSSSSESESSEHSVEKDRRTKYKKSKSNKSSKESLSSNVSKFKKEVVKEEVETTVFNSSDILSIPSSQASAGSDIKVEASASKPEGCEIPTESDVFKSTELEIKKLLAANQPDPPQLKIKSLDKLVENKVETVGQVDEGDEEADEEGGDTKETGSFLGALEKLDEKVRKSPKKSHKSTHKSSSHKSPSHSHKSSSSHHKSSRDKSSSRHKSSKSSSSDHKKSSHSDRHKSSSKSKHSSSSSSRHHKLKDKKSDKEEDKGEKQKYTAEEIKSPIPDFSEELALLPDFMDEDIGDFDNVADGLEEMFAGVDEEDELQRIFEEYQPGADLDLIQEDASLRKQKQLEEKARLQAEPSSSSSSAAGKKRVAHEGAETSEKRPLHMRKPSQRTPAQVMADRYRKLQMMRQQQMIEKRMSELTEQDPGEGPSTSTSSQGLGSSSGKSRVAHTASVQSPAVLSKAKQQLAAREKAKEVLARTGKTPAVTNTKGTARTAHTPTTAAVTRPLVTPDPHSKVPNTVRQKYLDTIIVECLKISGGDELEAYTRAEREEQACCRKASSRMLYLNLVVSCIKKLRAEAAQRPSPTAKKTSLNLAEKRPMLTTHMQVLAGKPGSVGTWSIEVGHLNIYPAV